MALAFAVARATDELVIDVFDVIGRDFWGDGISSRSIAETLLANPDAKTITVRINSPGGDVFEGHAIFNLLRSHGAKVTVEIVGLAASMGSILALAGDHVRMASNAMFMIHDPWALAMGSADEVRKTANMLDKIKASLLAIYERGSNLAKEALASMMSEETWLTAAEALEAGFVDEIMSDQREPNRDADASARFAAVLGRFAHAPAPVFARLRDAKQPRHPDTLPTPAPALAAATAVPARSNKMDRDKLISILGLSPEATDEQIEAAVASKPEASSAKPTVDLQKFVPRADYDMLRDRLAQQERAEQERQQQAFAARVDDEIGSAVQAGKITPATKATYREWILALGDDGLAKFRDLVAAAPEIAGNEQMQRAEARDSETRGLPHADAKLLARLGVTESEFKATLEDMRSKPEIYPSEAYPLV